VSTSGAWLDHFVRRRFGDQWRKKGASFHPRPKDPMLHKVQMQASALAKMPIVLIRYIA
jgi:hypothetical protein